MQTLRDLYYTKGTGYYSTDKGSCHSYIDTYDKLFEPFQNKKINILEVGVLNGGSLKLWNEYFINAKIIGYDNQYLIDKNIINENVKFILKSIKDVTLDEFIDTPITIAIDDASHEINDQLYFIKTVYPQIADGGILIVEDIQDIDNQKVIFEQLGIPFEVIDLRATNNRYDDVLLLYRKNI
jgi:hypothetical protein